jgi:hypothetical protein
VSKYRKDAKRDEAEPDVVKALKKAGWDVHRDLPIDLLCLKREGNLVKVRLLEVKTPTKTGKRRKRKDQEEQEAFCKAYDVPCVLTPFEALLAVGESVEL